MSHKSSTVHCLIVMAAFAGGLSAQETAAPDAALKRALTTAGATARQTDEAATEAGRAGTAGRTRIAAMNRRAKAAAAGIAAPPTETRPAEIPEATRAALEIAIGSDDAKATAALDALKAGSPEGAAAVKRFASRCEDVYFRMIEQFVLGQLATNALFAGQYTALRDFGPETVPALVTWAGAARRTIRTDAPQFRAGCVRALRDVIAGKASDDVMTALTKLTKREGDPAGLAAAFALAQFGDRSLVDAAIKLQTALIADSGTEDKPRAAALDALADLYYNTREYKAAAAQYQALAAMLVKAGGSDRLGNTYYNGACCYALSGATDEALDFLDKAFKASGEGQGVAPRTVEADKDLESIKKDPRFKKLLASWGAAPTSNPASRPADH